MALTLQIECIMRRPPGLSELRVLESHCAKRLVVVLSASATLKSKAEQFTPKRRFAPLTVIGLKSECPHSLWSRKDLIYDRSLNICQSKISSTVSICESLVIQSEQV